MGSHGYLALCKCISFRSKLSQIASRISAEGYTSSGTPSGMADRLVAARNKAERVTRVWLPAQRHHCCNVAGYTVLDVGV
jgi:hypothetical protein